MHIILPLLFIAACIISPFVVIILKGKHPTLIDKIHHDHAEKSKHNTKVRTVHATRDTHNFIYRCPHCGKWTEYHPEQKGPGAPPTQLPGDLLACCRFCKRHHYLDGCIVGRNPGDTSLFQLEQRWCDYAATEAFSNPIDHIVAYLKEIADPKLTDLLIVQRESEIVISIDDDPDNPGVERTLRSFPFKKMPFEAASKIFWAKLTHAVNHNTPYIYDGLTLTHKYA